MVAGGREAGGRAWADGHSPSLNLEGIFFFLGRHSLLHMYVTYDIYIRNKDIYGGYIRDIYTYIYT